MKLSRDGVAWKKLTVLINILGNSMGLFIFSHWALRTWMLVGLILWSTDWIKGEISEWKQIT